MAYHANDPDVGMSLVMNLRYYINLLHYNNRLLLSLHFPDDSNILPITKLYKFKIVQFKIAGAAENNCKRIRDAALSIFFYLFTFAA